MKKHLGIIVCIMSSFTFYIYRVAFAQFGKTHFIVGYEHKAVPLTKECNILSSVNESCSSQAFFTSRHDVRSIVLSLLKKAEKTISIATFTMTDKIILECLKKAHERGVIICVLTDPGTMQERHSKIKVLSDMHIPVFHYNPSLNPNTKQKKGHYTSLMHHKFIIIDDEIVVTGSSNLTHAGQVRNMENIVILKDKDTIQEYQKEFEHLKTMCIAC